MLLEPWLFFNLKFCNSWNRPWISSTDFLVAKLLCYSFFNEMHLRSKQFLMDKKLKEKRFTCKLKNKQCNLNKNKQQGCFCTFKRSLSGHIHHSCWQLYTEAAGKNYQPKETNKETLTHQNPRLAASHTDCKWPVRLAFGSIIFSFGFSFRFRFGESGTLSSTLVALRTANSCISGSALKAK